MKFVVKYEISENIFFPFDFVDLRSRFSDSSRRLEEVYVTLIENN